MHRPLSLILLAAALSTSLGCTLAQKAGMASVTPNGVGHDGTESSDPWVMEAAAEGRRDFHGESARDPLGLRPYFMSQKARDIERNVGIME